MKYKIVLTEQAKAMLAGITDRRVREKIGHRIDGLSNDPEKQGKALTGDLAGYRSIRAVGQRYRIIYSVEREDVVVLILAVGIRKQGSRSDLYHLARKLLRLKLLKPSKVKSKKKNK